MKSTIPGACRPAGYFENKTSTAPKLGLGLGAELGNIEPETHQLLKIMEVEQ